MISAVQLDRWDLPWSGSLDTLGFLPGTLPKKEGENDIND